MIKQLPSLVSEKILMAIHDAGWSFGITCADFPCIGLLYVVDATKHDSHRYVAQAETELEPLIELWGMLMEAEASTDSKEGLNYEDHQKDP